MTTNTKEHTHDFEVAGENNFGELIATCSCGSWTLWEKHDY